MTMVAGIPFVHLFELADTVELVLPQSVQDFVERFVVVEHTASQSDGAIFHRGRIAPVDDAIDEIPTDFNLGIGRLSLPLVQLGIPFQLAFVRKPATGNLEPNPDVWRLDLSLDVFTLTVDGLQPALYVPETGTAPRHLVRDTSRSSVKITGSAVLRIEVPSAGPSVQVSFIDQPDPFDPTAASGAVATLTCTPPHFFIGGSEFGLTVGRLEFDFSESYSPPDVLARDQGPAWMGVAIAEATFYAPRNLPGLGDLSGGVKNVLLGRPVGLQGELEIQFGRTAMNPATFQFKQGEDASATPLGMTGSGLAWTVTIQASHDEDVPILAGFQTPGPPSPDDVPAGGIQDWSADWTWPDETVESGDSSSGTVRHGQVLKVTPIETVKVGSDSTDFRHPEISFRFVAAGTRPSINATVKDPTGTLSDQHFTNVVHLGGTKASVTTVTLEAVSGSSTPGTFEWEIAGQPGKTTGATFVPVLDDLRGGHLVILREKVTPPAGEEETRVGHLEIMSLTDVELLVGCEAGVFKAADAATPLKLAAVESTFDLSDFHAQGKYTTKTEQAEIDAGDATKVDVPADGLARVTIDGGTPSTPATDRHVQILMDFDTAHELSWGDARPAGSTDGFSQANLLTWAARYPDAQFLVVGRCDDIGSDVYNKGLAKDRATRGRDLLASAPDPSETAVDAAKIAIRGEQDAFTGSPDGNALEEDPTLGLTPNEKSEARSGPFNGRLIELETDAATWTDHARYVNGVLSEHEATRVPYRRVDIYAVGGTPASSATLPTDDAVSATLRRALVPASGADPAPVTPGSPSLDYRVKLRIAWNSPTVSDLRDAIPTLAEAEFAWTPQTMPLPDVDSQAVDLSRETLTVFVNWAHDTRTGYTKASLGIKSEGDPDGLISTQTKPLIAALAFGPALLSGLDANTDLVGTGARVAALLAVVGFASVDLGDGPLVGDGSKAALISVALETEMRSIADPAAAMQIRAVTDYVTTIHVNGGVLGIKTAPDKPMKIRYKRVGLQYDTTKQGWDRFGIVYDSTSLEIEDPGKWQIDGILGELLRIVEVALGTGSFWIEGRIAIALDLGLVEISEAIIRLTFKGAGAPEFELRGFVVKVDITDVLEGEGRLRIEDGGLVRAGVDASIIPAGLAVQAAIAFAKENDASGEWIFLSLFMGVQFSTPLPLANSGLAIYGFKGLFTMNGSRDFTHIANPDPVLKELDWWATPPESKYKPDHGQFALGVGVVVGTMPDASFCVSCAGMLVVAFPDIEVILGVDVNIIQVPDTEASDDSGGQSASITGLIVIDDKAIKLAASAQYTIPSVLEVKAPFAGYFPYPGSGDDVYVRIGSDGQTAYKRYGQPVTLKLLPGTLDVQAWTYLMIEQGGLSHLGGDARFSFEGFSVGFGAGFEVKWSAGPIKLEASASVLVGFGTAPLMLKGGIFVKGELDLVVVSISAHADLVLEAREFKQGDGSQAVAIKIDGELCGEVDLFFFSVSGCVTVHFDLSPDMIPPAPPSPVKGIALTDRHDRVMGVATTGTPTGAAVFVPDNPNAGAAVDTNHVVWPDTAPVVSFAHYVENAMPAASQFTPGPTPTQDKWFGSSALKYAYRLDSLVLRRDDGTLVTGSKPLLSVWGTSPYRQPDASGSGGPLPSEHEGPSLKLLDWNPWAWVVNMTSGGAGQPGDPVTTVGTVCDPKPAPQRTCVLGRTARRAGLNRARMRSEKPPQAPYPSRFYVTGEPVVRLGSSTLRGRPLVTLITLTGGQLVPGSVVALPFPATVDGEGLTTGYRFPAARRAIAGSGLQDVPLPWEGEFSQKVTDPQVTLLICDASGQGAPPAGGACDDFAGLKPDAEVQVVARPSFTVRTLAANTLLVLVDQVDQTQSPAVPGSDGSAEIRIPDAGVEIRLVRPADRVEVTVMLFARPVKGEALAADGSVIATDSTSAAQRVEQRLVFEAPGIAAVRLRGGGNEALLLEVCASGGDTGTTCIDFSGARMPEPKMPKWAWRGLDFASRDGSSTLSLVDRVDARPDPDKPGKDATPELSFAEAGLRVGLPSPADALELHLFLGKGAAVRAVATDATGARVWRGETGLETDRPQVLRPQARGIAAVELVGGAGAAVLYEVCLGPMQAPTPTHGQPGLGRGALATHVFANAKASPDVLAGQASTHAATTVTGMVGDTPVDGWPGTTVDRREGRDGRVCELVTFRPGDPKAGPWDGFRVEPPIGKTATLVSVCGIDQRAADNRANDTAVASQLVSILTGVIMLPPDERREIVLDPDTTYEVEVGWSWQAWVPPNPDDQPPDPDPNAWTAGPADTLRFHTAADESLAGQPQDGLNEYVFDARDVERYVVAVEPADGRLLQFTDDPIWVHLDAGHVQQLLELYGRTLQIEVKRTDPPPQPSPALLATALAPIAVTLELHDQSTSTEPVGYRRINAALGDPHIAPCVPPGGPMGGTSIAVTGELAPDADYDLNLVAPKGADRPVVLATRFRTSHYTAPRALVDALGYTTATAPYLPDDLVIPDGMAFPAGGFVEGDSALDAALAAIDAETLPLPTAGARSYVVWSHDAALGWRVEGLIVDSPESLQRQATVVDASGVASQGTRMAPLSATIGAASLTPWRANARWTRVVFRPAGPVTVPGPESTLALTFTTSEGTVAGSRRVLAVPSVLEREGL